MSRPLRSVLRSCKRLVWYHGVKLPLALQRCIKLPIAIVLFCKLIIRVLYGSKIPTQVIIYDRLFLESFVTRGYLSHIMNHHRVFFVVCKCYESLCKIVYNKPEISK